MLLLQVLLSCDSLAHSVLLRARFCQAFSSPPSSLPPPRLCCFFSPLMFSVSQVPVPFLSCGGSWLGCAVVPVMQRALFQSRGWLPIMEAPGYSRQRTSIWAMQLLITILINTYNSSQFHEQLLEWRVHCITVLFALFSVLQQWKQTTVYISLEKLNYTLNNYFLMFWIWNEPLSVYSSIRILIHRKLILSKTTTYME